MTRTVDDAFPDWQQQAPSASPALGQVSAWFGVVATAVTAVTHATRDPGLPSPLDPLLDVLSLALLALLLASLLFLLLPRRASALPLIINLGTLLIVNTVPFGAMWQEAAFRWRWRSYETAVAAIVAAPPEQQSVAAAAAGFGNGRVAIDRRGNQTHLFFYIAQAGDGHFTGYYYRPDGLPPQPGDFGGQWREVRQQRPYWYYCVSRP